MKHYLIKDNLPLIESSLTQFVQGGATGNPRKIKGTKGDTCTMNAIEGSRPT